MNINTFIISVGFIFNVNSKPIYNSNEIEKNNNDYNNALKILSTSLNDNDSISDPSKIFSKSITQYKEEFNDYIDITALNVIDKTEVSLPEFDINYKAPSFQEVMYKYQVNLESCLDSSHLLKYENFRKQDYSFDRYVALNSTKYSSLNVNTKYNHIVAASLSSGISGLTLILQNAGLGTVAIEAFVAAVTTLTSVVSTSWIPVTGGSLAIALAAGALIGLTVIIVQNWDNIKSSMDDIKNWFLNQFSSFASLIRNFFSDVGTKGDKSKVVGREKIGDKEITRTEIIIKSDSDASFVEQSRKNPNIVFLMRQIKKYYYENENVYYTKYWGWDGIVDQDFVKKYNIYDLGISTYVFFKNTAFDLISNGTILIKNNMVNDLGYPYKVIQHDFDEDEYLENGFRHYHVYEYKSKNNVYDYYKINGMSINKSHSLFGELLWKNNK